MAVVLGLARYKPGIHTFGPVAVPPGTVQFTLTVNVSQHTDPSVGWGVRLEFTRAVGDPRIHGISRKGSLEFDEQGVFVATASMRRDLPGDAVAVSRQFQLVGGILKTEIALEFSS